MKRWNLISWPLALGAGMLLTACSGSGAPGAQAPGAPVPDSAQSRQVSSGQAPRNQCDAQAAQFLVGQPFGVTTLEQARAAAGADEARMLRPNSIVTKELKLGRLNVVVDADQRVSRVHCG